MGFLQDVYFRHGELEMAFKMQNSFLEESNINHKP